MLAPVHQLRYTLILTSCSAEMSGHRTWDKCPGSPALNPDFWFTGRKGSGCKASSLCSGTKDEPTPIAPSRCGVDNVHCQVVYVGANDAVCHLCTEHLQVFLAGGGKIDSNSPPHPSSGARTARGKESDKYAQEPAQTNTTTRDQPDPLTQQPDPDLGESSKQVAVCWTPSKTRFSTRPRPSSARPQNLRA